MEKDTAGRPTPESGGDDPTPLSGESAEVETVPGRRARRWTAVVGIVFAVGLLIAATLWLRCGVRGCPDVGELRGYMPDEASLVLDRDGAEIGKLFLVRRVVVPLDSLPEFVPAGFVAVEDRRFWDHGGVDWPRIAGAAFRNVRALEYAEGFSTITMQLSRNLFPDRLPANEKALWRKFGEMRVAREIEREYSKAEILELYINQIYFGNGAWGIEAAAQEYFGKHAHELTVAEAALLAGLPQAPSRLNPRANRALALERRNVVLGLMAEEEWITAEQASEARAAGVELARGDADAPERAAYFIEEVRRRLEPVLGDALYTSGLAIHTTLDLELQEVAERELERQLRAIESGAFGAFRHITRSAAEADSTPSDGTAYLQGALVIMDVRTGGVLALIGGRDFDDSEFNRATQAERQVGSAFKPFVYATALERGYPPTLPLDDQPIRMVLDNGRTWSPSNYAGDYAGRVTLRRALTESRNSATVQLAQRVGLDGVLDMARTLGLDADLPRLPSVVLGSAEANLLELITAYSAFATLGQRVEPRFVTRVEDRNGRVLWEEPVEARRVLDPDVAFLVTNILQDVVNRGTATAVRSVGFRGAAAGKTGTTNDAADAWFIGYTSTAVGGVWVGFDERQTIVPRASGGTIAAPVWGRVMRHLGDAGRGWSPTPGVEEHPVDEAGNVLTEGCVGYGSTRMEYFLRGTAALTTCWPSYDVYAYRGDALDMYDSLYVPPSREDDESWFERMRRRVFGDRDSLLTPPPSSQPLPPIGRDSAVRPDPPPVPQPEDDDGPELLGRPVNPDSGHAASGARPRR